ncbi:MAG: serine O-acetyltransferase [Actinomycetia bacterium]|nr:serine O-acetyltransferase [Actinomycetes bacterium]
MSIKKNRIISLVNEATGLLKEDIRVIKERDPAAKGVLEIALSYPGLHAIWMHRLAHYLDAKGVPLLPRLISMFTRAVTGIEVHQGAKLGRGLFIDHGMGVVIGETAEVGENVTMYQGVTLGGTGKEKGKRHPTIGNNVVIAAGASVLGPITVGDNSKVGAGAVVLKDVPANCTVVGVPGRLTICSGETLSRINLHHGDLPDPLMEVFEDIDRRLEKVERAVGNTRQLEPPASEMER